MGTPLLLLGILVFLLWICESCAQPNVNVFARSCRNVRVRNKAKYEETYSKLIQQMNAEMGQRKYSFKEDGEAPDRLYLFSQCINVLSNSECRSCFKTISELLPGCFPYTGGRAHSDGCFIRAENYSFYHEIIGPDDLKRCGDSKEKNEKFSSMAKHLINQMASEAPDHDGFISMQQESPSGLAVHGLATCWMMLERDICSACLSNAASTALSCLPSIEGRVHNAGCFLRYADYDFTSEARAREARDTLLKYVSYGLAAIAACSLAIIIGYCVGKSTYKLSCLARNRKGLEINLSILKRSFPFVPFNYSTLAKATDDFNESFKLGEGGFGTIYKGILPDGREIAIKRLFVSRKNRTQDIYNEMDVISRVQHKNLVRFIGYCFTSADSFLVYEFLANKSLDYMLLDPEQKKQLDWPKRLGIIIGTAEGLEYLHKNCQVQIIHRDIKASNILLDLKFRPRIADFGLAKFMSCGKTHVSTAIEGTLGYMAPEYLAEGRITEKVDVFSFGVLVLEIVCGVQNSKFQPAETFETLVGHAWKHFQRNTAAEIIDESMESKDVDEILRFIHVGLLCVQESPCLRPSMTEVIKMLNQRDEELPAPSKPPFTDSSLELSSSPCSSWRQQSNVSDSSRPLNFGHNDV